MKSKKPSLAELLAATKNFDRVPGWEELPDVGREVWQPTASRVVTPEAQLKRKRIRHKAKR